MALLEKNHPAKKRLASLSKTIQVAMDRFLDLYLSRTSKQDTSREDGKVQRLIVFTSKICNTKRVFIIVSLLLVYFHEIPDRVIDSLIEDGVALNIAGGLMLEHPLTSPFVESMAGTTDCVMGLSKSLTERLMRAALQIS